MSNISFFTPVVFEQDRTLGQNLLEKVDGYFSLFGKRAFVISPIRADQSYDVTMKDYPGSSFQKLIFTALKIMSYVLFCISPYFIAIPASMFFAKLALRANYSFHLVQKTVSIASTVSPACLDPKKDKAQPSSLPTPPSLSPEESYPIKERCKCEFEGRDIFAFGDVHGELDGFKKNLRKSGVTDENGHWVKGNTAIVIQMGDVIDRGPKSLEAENYLDQLQTEAFANGGIVIKLIGNHELLILQKNYLYSVCSGMTLDQCKELREKIIEDIKANKLLLAWSDGTRLYTHAKARTAIRGCLVKEILEERKKEKALTAPSSEPEPKEEIFFEDLENYANILLKKAVDANDFSHRVFDIGKSRGGNALIGGLLWEDDSSFESLHAGDMKQLNAHVPPKPGEEPIRISPSGNIINVDAGLCGCYGNNNAFVQLHDQRVFIHKKEKDPTGGWKVAEFVPCKA